MQRSITQFAIGSFLLISSISSQAALYTGSMLFSSVEKYSMTVAAHTRGSFDPGTAMTMGYVMGVADADPNICPNPQASVAQFMIIVDRYMQSHQELLNKSAAVSVSAALRAAFPCPK